MISRQVPGGGGEGTDYYRTLPLFLKCQELQFHRTAQFLVDGLKFELLFGLVYGRRDMKTVTPLHQNSKTDNSIWIVLQSLRSRFFFKGSSSH